MDKCIEPRSDLIPCECSCATIRFTLVRKESRRLWRGSHYRQLPFERAIKRRAPSSQVIGAEQGDRDSNSASFSLGSAGVSNTRLTDIYSFVSLPRSTTIVIYMDGIMRNLCTLRHELVNAGAVGSISRRTRHGTALEIWTRDKLLHRLVQTR